MATKPENARYEAKRKAEGWVRGPRITADAAEQLRVLAHRHRLTPAEVVSRLLLEIPLGSVVPPVGIGAAGGEQRARTAFQQRHRLSDSEMADMDREVESYVGR